MWGLSHLNFSYKIRRLIALLFLEAKYFLVGNSNLDSAFYSVFYNEYTSNHKRNELPFLPILNAIKLSFGLVVICKSVILNFF